MRRRVTPLLALAAIAGISAAASEAEAKPKLGIELKLGITAPLPIFDTYLRGVSFIPDPTSMDPDIGIPIIADARSGAGLGGTLMVTFRGYEVLLSAYGFSWGKSEKRFVGDRPARKLDEDNIDDAGVIYAPIDPAETIDPVIDSSGLTVLTFGASYRYYLSEGGTIEPYVPIGGGITGVQVRDEGEFNNGVHLWTGVSADVALGDFAMVFDVRYNFLLTGEAGSAQQSVNNAVVADEGVLFPLFSALHFVTIQIGGRFDFGSN